MWTKLIKNICLPILFICVLFSPISGLDTKVVTEDDSKHCEIDLHACKLNLDLPGVKGDKGDLGPVGLTGAKGERGDIGIPGLPGVKGDKGDLGPEGPAGVRGERGYDGLPGLTGSKGDKGDMGPEGREGVKGERGDNGIPGLQGLRGDKGDLGPVGLKGEPGNNGDLGLKGDKGDIGPKGEPGSCAQTYDDDGTGNEGSNNPNKYPKSCKEIDYKNSGGEVMIGSNNPFIIDCRSDGSTCLLSLGVQVDIENDNFSHKNKPFWLSEFNKFDLEKFYWQYTMENFKYLLKQSTKVTQKIKYHCFNSFVNPDDSEKSLQLYLLNGEVIGPTPSATSPFHYNIVKDNCKDSENKWEYAEIELVQDVIYGKLPIKDFYIRDIRSMEQKFYIELTEMCFV